MLSVWKMPYHAQENKFPGSAVLLAVWLLSFKSWANRYREQADLWSAGTDRQGDRIATVVFITPDKVRATESARTSDLVVESTGVRIIFRSGNSLPIEAWGS